MLNRGKCHLFCQKCRLHKTTWITRTVCDSWKARFILIEKERVLYITLFSFFSNLHKQNLSHHNEHTSLQLHSILHRLDHTWLIFCQWLTEIHNMHISNTYMSNQIWTATCFKAKIDLLTLYSEAKCRAVHVVWQSIQNKMRISALKTPCWLCCSGADAVHCVHNNRKTLTVLHHHDCSFHLWISTVSFFFPFPFIRNEIQKYKGIKQITALLTPSKGGRGVYKIFYPKNLIAEIKIIQQNSI